MKCQAWGSLFKAATICPEVVERPFDATQGPEPVEGHQNQMPLTAAPQIKVFQALFPFVPVLNSISRRDGGGKKHKRHVGCDL